MTQASLLILVKEMKHWNKISLAAAALLAYLAFKAETFQALEAMDSRNIVGIFAQISATMLGFLMAALSILATVSGNRLMRNLRKTGHYRSLLSGFFLNTVAFTAAMLASFAALLISNGAPWTYLIAFYLFALAWLFLVNVGYKLWVVLNNLSAD